MNSPSGDNPVTVVLCSFPPVLVKARYVVFVLFLYSQFALLFDLTDNSTVPSGTVELSVRSNNNRNCEYKKSTETTYLAFTSTGGKLHRTTVTGLSPDGEFIYDVRCTYLVYANSTQIAFNLDTTLPVVPIITSDHPENDWSNEADAVFAWAPGIDVSQIVAYLYGISNSANCDAATYQNNTLNTTGYSGLADGSHAFCARSIDEFGRVGATGKYVIRIDTVPPTSHTIDSEAGG